MSQPRFQAHFGGPDRPQALRQLLTRRLAAVPAGGQVAWVTYYFRDRPLARDLLAAASRGVDVRLVLEGRPRIAQANAAVIALLSATGGLGDGLRTIAMRGIPAPFGLAWKPQVHEKIYCFSAPVPVALMGSFNPSGDCPEESPNALARIGDHHIAHNLLVEINDPDIVACLAAHVRDLHQNGPWLFWRRAPGSLRDADFGDTQLHFWPRRGPHPIECLLKSYGSGSRIRLAASHLRNPAFVTCLARLAAKGAQVEVLAEHTARRVPPRVERRLTSAGVRIARLGGADKVPMHLKFVLAETADHHHTAFGSFNWTLPSYHLNHEVGIITRDTSLFEQLDRHWESLCPVDWHD